ncbi:hypothetical protein SAMN04488122_2511 [Chitinophaga arvensicola]|uniref:Uncharacterized protein n=2 Tax=Chitinophaga arvensicola TaxID=29529 RepID=A0A1I0RA45_9BACT|nr:hypothetical protein SAMN04488122_2511 [Chitinophaga arvensicola]
MVTQLGEIGKAALNMRYPKEFEYYVCAFELIDANDNTLRYFIFPVMPSSIDETQPRITNIRKTAGGVVALSSTNFAPVDITMAGNFGRKLRILLGSSYTDFISSLKVDNKITIASAVNGIKAAFDDSVKTGYGCLKILEDIIREADKVDKDGPRRLIFYNLAFGNSYIVKPTSFKISMNQDTNMIHSYNLTMKGIAPIEALYEANKPGGRNDDLRVTSVCQKNIDKIVNTLGNIFK